MFLLDTDTLTHLHHGHPRVIERLRQAESTEVGTTIVTKVEILRGRYDSLLKAADSQQLLKAQARIEQSERLLREMLIVEFDDDSVSEFDRLRRNKRLAKIGRADILIASIVRACDATLVTRNLLHFRQVPAIKVENWMD
jgi:tRNA(fMet)-specific endonuclease VapC